MPAAVVSILFVLLGLAAAADVRVGDRATVTGTIAVIGKGSHAGDSGNVAIWLKPIGETGTADGESAPARPRPRILQKNKQFSPRVLVVSVGEVVDFPNDDPFFHNVFSLFEGKRFDLGLYEAGASRSVPFTRPGVCYIFCNIHPEMSAVVLVVDTPYHAVSTRAGEFAIPAVPPGRYALSVWHERHRPERPEEFPRTVTISPSTPSVGIIRFIESNEVIAPHKNKYGHDYTPPRPISPIYKPRS